MLESARIERGTNKTIESERLKVKGEYYLECKG